MAQLMKKGMVDITGLDLKKFINTVYRLSEPKGYGLLHYQPGELEDKEVDQILSQGDRLEPDEDGVVISMDYVNGRACKMSVWREKGRLLIKEQWYDHTKEDMDRLLKILRD